MDPRIKKILDENNARRAEEAKQQAKIFQEEEQIKKELLDKHKVMAKEWVDKNIIDLIEKAEAANQNYVELDSQGWKKDQPNYEGIPAYLLAEATEKIEGLRVEKRLVKGYNDPDYGSEDDRYVYEVWWKPKPPDYNSNYYGR